MKSLTKNPGEFTVAKSVEWKRAKDFLGDKVKVFEGKIEPNDIKQG